MKRPASNPLVTLVTGGAKCGKSRYALQLCESMPGGKTFLASAQAGDEEMVERIQRHRRERGEHWHTLEEPLDVVSVLSSRCSPHDVVLFDCVTIWLSNVMMKYGGERDSICTEIDRLADFLSNCAGPVVVVSNEVGMGIVPADPMTRLYRDLAGQANQEIASVAGAVVLMAAGIPMILKSKER